MSRRLFTHTLLVGCLGLLAALAAPSVGRADLTVHAGYDLFATTTGTTFNGVPFMGVPLGTFNFGVPIGTQNTSLTDTIVQRLDTVNASDNTPGLNMGTTRLLMNALQLESTVPTDFGLGTDFYFITLQSARSTGGPASTGSMIISFNNPETTPVAGTFSSSLDVFFDVRKGALNGPVALSSDLVLTSVGTPWSHIAPPGVLLIQGANFLLKGDGTINQDFWPVPPGGTFQESTANDTHVVMNDPAPVPEPGSVLLLSIGVLGLAGYGWRRRQLAV
jgi:hypothetical protein